TRSASRVVKPARVWAWPKTTRTAMSSTMTLRDWARPSRARGRGYWAMARDQVQRRRRKVRRGGASRRAAGGRASLDGHVAGGGGGGQGAQGEQGGGPGGLVGQAGGEVGRGVFAEEHFDGELDHVGPGQGAHGGGQGVGEEHQGQ